ncbi:hypothetical protein LMG31506_05200 [Cupriavidus yeoncheonensis]|uniref:Lipoprotein n=1 Tax=Cupriavidus yeoncheonensis TaxID=1462994 RepID=A0A916MXK1_9BURK|nr:hypothetical protein [Cupriavidus yeoncheonensis]CAG2154846.1 hypothetical protein LMG31506_05200 [Cupriavidus yeoncheonensis]
MKVLHLISGLLFAMMVVAACSTDSGTASPGSSAQSQRGSSRGTGDGYRGGY